MKSAESSNSKIRMDLASAVGHGHSQSMDMGTNSPNAPKLSSYFNIVHQRYSQV